MKLHLIALFYIGMLAVSSCQVEGVAPEANQAVISESVRRSLASVDPDDQREFFAYDRSLPLDIQIGSVSEKAGTIWRDFTYASPRGGRVPARIIAPTGHGPFPGILLMHGSAGDIELYSDAAEAYARLGAVVMLIESPHIRPGGREWTGTMGDSWPYFSARDREDQIQLMIDLRRAIDILGQETTVNADRLAYIGYSYGGAMGGLLAGIEDRLKAYVLVVGDGGLIEHTSEPMENGLPDQFRTTWVEAMWPIEPIHFVGQAAPAALLFQNGLQDQLVPPGDALRYQIAGSEPKTVIWYDAGHNLEPAAFQDSAIWLQDYLGDQLLWMVPDYRPTARWIDAAFTVWLLVLALSTARIIRRELQREETNKVTLFFWGLAGLVLGPVGLLLHCATQTRSGAWLKFMRVMGPWQGDLDKAVQAGMVFLLGGLLGNILSALFFGGDTIILTYLAALIVGWVLFRVFRDQVHIQPMLWLIIVNLLWAADALLSLPLMNFWRLPFMLHPRLIGYIGSLTLCNVVFLTVLFALLRRVGLVGEESDQLHDGSLMLSPMLGWPTKAGLILLSFGIDFVAVVVLMSSIT